MEAERSKVAELQANHLAISRQLAAAKSQELNQRQELSIASDEIINLKKSHAREIMDLEMDMKRKERELRDLADELRLCRGDLEREREAVSSLKSTISHQSTAHLSLTTQNHALQAQNTALESQLEVYASTVSKLSIQLAESNKLSDELRQEVRDAEGVRRKLHNMVQELKGNIRVFCRVRPALTDDEEADIVFPDKRDHKEILLASSSENAMGQERKEVYNFAFDRVRYVDLAQCNQLTSLDRSLSLNPLKLTCLKRSPSSRRVAPTGTTYASSRMGRQDLESPSRWKGER